jgi:hypothetical protein
MTLTQPYLSHLTGVFHAPVQAWSRADGGMGAGAEGIYCGDERIVSEAGFTVAEHELRHVSTQVRSATEVAFVYVVTAPAEVPDPLLTVTRTRHAAIDGVSEELRIASALREPVDVDLDLVLGLDSLAMEQIKTGHTDGGRARPRPDATTWSWRDEDTAAELSVDGGTVDVRGASLAARWSLHLSPGADAVVGWTLRASDAAAPVLGTTLPPVPAPRLDTPDQRLQRLADRAFSDLNSLRIADRSQPDAVFLAAGAPWFYTMFGRDSLIAARMLLPVDRSLAEGTLRALAARQGTKVDEEEQPQQAVRKQVQHPNDGIRDFEQRVIDERCRQGDTRRIQCGDRLRSDLAKDQYDDREYEGCDENGSLPADALRDDRHERGRRDVDGVVAEQDQPDQAIGSLQEPLGDARATVPGARLVTQPIPIETHQRRLGAREEGGQHEQHDDQDDQQT